MQYKAIYFISSRVSLLAMLIFVFLSTNATADTVPNVIDLASEPIQPVELPDQLDKKRVELGEKLFNDVRLSSNNTVACASCHIISKGGALDRRDSLPGVSGKSVPINIPTVFGSGHNFVQFWDGRASTLEDQIDGPTQNPDEMGSSWQEITGKLQTVPEYSKAFMDIYHTPPTAKNIKDAIASFERSLVPVNSPFDQYLRGDKNAISPNAKAGYAMFKDFGCVSCHQGANVGGNMYQKFGVMGDYFKDRGNVIDKDYGRFSVTKSENDRYVFKVPSLRNVEQTAPYFHDGSAATLDKAVDVMAKYQLGRTLSNDERSKLVAYLKSLTGTMPERDTAPAPKGNTP